MQKKFDKQAAEAAIRAFGYDPRATIFEFELKDRRKGGSLTRDVRGTFAELATAIDFYNEKGRNIIVGKPLAAPVILPGSIKWEPQGKPPKPKKPKKPKTAKSASGANSRAVEIPKGPAVANMPFAEIFERDSDITPESLVEATESGLVAGIVFPGDTGIIYGAPGTLKSFLMGDLGHCVAQGRDWHGRRVRQAPVLYATLEGTRGFRFRMAAAAKVRGPAPWFFRYRLHVTLVKSEAGAHGADQIIAACRRIHKETGETVGLVVIDTLARATAGDNENETADMGRFIEARVGQIARATGAAVVAIHHENQRGDMRGSTALEGACDFVMHTKESEQGTVTLALGKLRDGEREVLFDCRLRQVDLGTTATGLPMRSAVLEKFDHKAKAKSDQKLSKPARMLKAAFAQVANNGVAPVDNVRTAFSGKYETPAAARQAWARVQGEIRQIGLCEIQVEGTTHLRQELSGWA